MHTMYRHCFHNANIIFFFYISAMILIKKQSFREKAIEITLIFTNFVSLTPKRNNNKIIIKYNPI